MNTSIGAVVGIAAVLVGIVSTAEATSSPAARVAAPCVVDVSDWPVGILPDDASAAFGPATLAACRQAAAGWPAGVLPDDPFAGAYPTASPQRSAGATSSAVGGAGAFVPGPAPTPGPDDD